MLVATAGHQTAAYSASLHSNKSSTTATTSTTIGPASGSGSGNLSHTSHTTHPTNSSSGSNNNTTTNKTCRSTASTQFQQLTTNSKPTGASAALLKTATKTTTTTSSSSSRSIKIAETTNAAANALLKTLSVRLSRGTDFIKGTVQKALINKSVTTTTTTAASSSSISRTHGGKTCKPTVNGTTTTNSTSSTASSISISSTLSSLSSASSAVSAGGEKGRAAVLVRGDTVAVGSASASTSASINTKIIVPTEEFLKLYAVPPSSIHHYPDREFTNSIDSVHIEHMCHFKPIRSAPTTPAKISSRSRGVTMKTPKAKFAPRVKVDFILNDPTLFADLRRKPKPHDDVDRNVLNLKEEDDDDDEEIIVYEYLKPKLNLTSLPTLYTPPTHRSAFVYLIAQMRDISGMPTGQQQQQKDEQAPTTMELPKSKSRRNMKRSTAAKSKVTKKAHVTVSVPLQRTKRMLAQPSQAEMVVETATSNSSTVTITGSNTTLTAKSPNKKAARHSRKKLSTTTTISKRTIKARHSAARTPRNKKSPTKSLNLGKEKSKSNISVSVVSKRAAGTAQELEAKTRSPAKRKLRKRAPVQNEMRSSSDEAVATTANVAVARANVAAAVGAGVETGASSNASMNTPTKSANHHLKRKKPSQHRPQAQAHGKRSMLLKDLKNGNAGTPTPTDSTTATALGRGVEIAAGSSGTAGVRLNAILNATKARQLATSATGRSTPPLTRSRLKQLPGAKLTVALR